MDWEGNFKYRGQVDVTALKERVHEQSETDWNRFTRRQDTFGPHRHTHSIPLLYDADFRPANPTPQPKFAAFEDVLRPVFEFLTKVYGPDGNIVRCLLTRLGGRLRIPRHVDRGFSLVYSHRIHIPLVTNDSVFFAVGDEEIAMKEGEVWEINNVRPHAVRNDSDVARVHLIIDCAPALTAKQRAIYELMQRAARGDAGGLF